MMAITQPLSGFDIYENESESVAGSAKPIPGSEGRLLSLTSTRTMKRILEIAVYKSGDLTSEVTALDRVNVRADGDTTVFTGQATVKSRFKGRDFSSLYRLSKVYEVRQGRWRVISSKTARLGDK